MAAPIIFNGSDSKLLTAGDLKDSANTVYPKIGEKTYCSQPSSYTSSSGLGWGVSAGTATTITSSLPRGVTSKQAIQYVSAASGDYLRYRFQIDDADKSTKLKAQFAQIVATAGDFNVEVWYGTSSALAGAAQLTLSTDASSVSALPALTGTYRTTFDTNTNTYYEIRWKATGSSKTLKISDVVVGPGVGVQGAAVSGPVQYTPTTNGFGTIASDLVWYNRVGSKIKVVGRFTTGTVAASEARVYLPTGLNIGTYSNTLIVGSWWINETTNGSAKRGDLTAYNGNPNYVIFSNDDTANTLSPFASRNGSQIAASAQVVGFTFEVEVAEWQGSGTVNVVQNDVEYAYNSSTSTSTDTTSFGYGPAGIGIQAYVASGTANVTKRVRFTTPIQSTDRLELEYWDTISWVPADSRGLSLQYNDAGTTAYGYFLTGINSTDVDVRFHSKGTIVDAWSAFAGTKWRLKKSSGGQAVGFGNYQYNVSSGLVRAAGYPATIQKFTSGSGTYTPSSGAAWIRVRMVGGGGGGGGGGTAAGTGAGAGGATTFGTNSAGGGGSGAWCGQGGAGGTVTLSLGTGTALVGGMGSPSTGSSASVPNFRTAGGSGGSSAFGGAGSGGSPGSAGTGQAGQTNTGGGGGGGENGGTGSTGSGGGSGGYVEAVISPAASYSYAVGAGGTAGGAGTGGLAGGAGGSGYIIVEEFYV